MHPIKNKKREMNKKSDVRDPLPVRIGLRKIQLTRGEIRKKEQPQGKRTEWIRIGSD